MSVRDQGSLFDEQGRFASWWTGADLGRFQCAGARLVA
jgi:predicted metalloendopeptidase